MEIVEATRICLSHAMLTETKHRARSSGECGRMSCYSKCWGVDGEMKELTCHCGPSAASVTRTSPTELPPRVEA